MLTNSLSMSQTTPFSFKKDCFRIKINSYGNVYAKRKSSHCRISCETWKVSEESLKLAKVYIFVFIWDFSASKVFKSLNADFLRWIHMHIKIITFVFWPIYIFGDVLGTIWHSRLNAFSMKLCLTSKINTISSSS